MRLFSNKKRPVHLTHFPLERLKRAPAPDSTLLAIKNWTAAETAAPDNLLAKVCRDYTAIYERYRVGEPAPEKAPISEDALARANELKSMALFFDATLVGCCSVPPFAWIGPPATQGHALVVVVECNDQVEADNPVYDLLRTSGSAIAKMRAAEVAVIISAHVRQLGFSATAHTPETGEVSLPVLAVSSGLARVQSGGLTAPFIGSRFAVSAVTTDMELCPDQALAPSRPFEGGAAWWLGVGGVETWWNRWLRRRRPGEWGQYPMEKVKRVDATTTLIIDEEVPRVPKRAGGFARARMGDFGEKASREVVRFAAKTPTGMALRVLQSALQPFQDGAVAPQVDGRHLDPVRNRRALKTLANHLGADVSGTCEAKAFSWYSHDYEGKPMDVLHKNALVVAIDQGFETMEGASGDDWVSGTQSYRAYLRGGQITGVIAAYIRSLGHAARSQTNSDSQVIQTPLVLLAGLGEMSRIGETVLNPFLGPRTKSAVVTTNIPLAWDKPIDFGLQDACGKCRKCARECPCSAITFGGTVMFNGYEIWKHDVQRCTSYRVTNQGGAACGRCMKMCPYNNEGLLIHRGLLWLATRFPATRRALADLDDKLGHGRINPVKKWWSNLEVAGGKVVKPKLVNARELDLAKGESFKRDPAKQHIAFNHASTLPPPNWFAPFPPNREAEVESGRLAETPQQARDRVRRGGARLPLYVPPGASEQAPKGNGTCAPSPMHKG
jgi:epoxyqueuosine reductase QueG